VSTKTRTPTINMT